MIPGLEHAAFAEMLERHAAREPVGVREHIARVHAEHVPPAREPFERGLAKLRRALDALERDADAGLEAADEALHRLPTARSAQQQIDLLRRIGRYERRVERALGGVPWLDPLVQLSLHEAVADVRRAGSESPTPEAAARESRTLFETTREGVERARRLCERLEVLVQEHLPAEGEGAPAGEA